MIVIIIGLTRNCRHWYLIPLMTQYKVLVNITTRVTHTKKALALCTEHADFFYK